MGDGCRGISSRACDGIEEASCVKGLCQCKVGSVASADYMSCGVMICEAGKTLAGNKRNCVPGISNKQDYTFIGVSPKCSH